MNSLKIDQPEILTHIFFPQSSDRESLPYSALNFDIEVDDGILLGCRMHLAEPSAPTILYFHGNGEVVNDYDDVADGYRYHSMNLIVTTYRGYGWSTGTPSVWAMYADAGILLKKVQEWLTANNYTGPLFIMGRSLGSAAAIDLTMRNQTAVKGLIIESGFSDTLPLAKNLGIDTERYALTEDDCFNNKKKIAAISLPTLILHGASDSLIPPVQAERLQVHSAARNKQYILIPRAEHNTMISTGGDLYFQTIKRFIDSVTGNTDWRKRRKAFKNMKDEK